MGLIIAQSGYVEPIGVQAKEYNLERFLTSPGWFLQESNFQTTGDHISHVFPLTRAPDRQDNFDDGILFEYFPPEGIFSSSGTRLKNPIPYYAVNGATNNYMTGAAWADLMYNFNDYMTEFVANSNPASGIALDILNRSPLELMMTDLTPSGQFNHIFSVPLCFPYSAYKTNIIEPSQYNYHLLGSGLGHGIGEDNAFTNKEIVDVFSLNHTTQILDSIINYYDDMFDNPKINDVHPAALQAWGTHRGSDGINTYFFLAGPMQNQDYPWVNGVPHRSRTLEDGPLDRIHSMGGVPCPQLSKSKTLQLNNLTSKPTDWVRDVTEDVPDYGIAAYLPGQSGYYPSVELMNQLNWTTEMVQNHAFYYRIQADNTGVPETVGSEDVFEVTRNDAAYIAFPKDDPNSNLSIVRVTGGFEEGDGGVSTDLEIPFGKECNSEIPSTLPLFTAALNFAITKRKSFDIRIQSEVETVTQEGTIEHVNGTTKPLIIEWRPKMRVLLLSLNKDGSHIDNFISNSEYILHDLPMPLDMTIPVSGTRDVEGQGYTDRYASSGVYRNFALITDVETSHRTRPDGDPFYSRPRHDLTDGTQSQEPYLLHGSFRLLIDTYWTSYLDPDVYQMFKDGSRYSLGHDNELLKDGLFLQEPDSALVKDITITVDGVEIEGEDLTESATVNEFIQGSVHEYTPAASGDQYGISIEKPQRVLLVAYPTYSSVATGGGYGIVEIIAESTGNDGTSNHKYSRIALDNGAVKIHNVYGQQLDSDIISPASDGEGTFFEDFADVPEHHPTFWQGLSCEPYIGPFSSYVSFDTGDENMQTEFLSGDGFQAPIAYRNGIDSNQPGELFPNASIESSPFITIVKRYLVRLLAIDENDQATVLDEAPWEFSWSSIGHSVTVSSDCPLFWWQE